MSAPPGPPPGRPPMSGMRPPGPPPGGPPGHRPPIHMGMGMGTGMNTPYPAPPFAPTFPPGPPNMPNFPPPLPAGWSEHTAPDGRTKYYYNSNTKESTYTRPSFAPLPNIGGSTGVPSMLPGIGSGVGVGSATGKEKKKKEKPKEKVPIGDTTWTRVTTTEGNVFYFEKESKRSEWTVPEEIREAVEELEREEREKKEAEEADRKRQEEEARLEKIRERERIRAEVEEERKKRLEEKERKRKERGDGENGVGGEDGEETREKKVSKTDANGQDGDEEKFAPEDEEAWMKAVAAEFAEQDAAAQAEKEADEEANERAEEEAAKKVFAVPEKVSVSLEEGRALFKALLIEKDISPFAPWDQSLPLFINDPRYILLGSMKDRKEVYEEYCRDTGRARRLNKSTSGASESKKQKQDPERDYKALLREEVTSTRTRWDDFRKKWKKERRFYQFGRDDRDREKVFKTHLKELGERKRADAQRAEQDFFDLLKEVVDLSSSSVWSQVKKGIASDPRYDAVGSSSLREELFNTHIRRLASTSTKHETPEEIAERKLKERKAKEEASLRERQAKVREEQEKAANEANKSRAGAGREEAARLFGSLLVDQVRDHEVTWNDAVQYLQNDPRFNHPSLRPHDKLRMFNEHIASLAGKRSNALHQLFQTHSPKLTTTYEEVYPKIVDDPLVKRLGLQGEALEERYKAWKRGKEGEARHEFDIMLGENSFVEFWGKMRKKTLDEAALKVKEDEMDEGEGLGDGGAADITALAKQIDLDEIKSVLRRDGRYRQFDHIPELREQWLQEYLERQEGLTGSETIHAVGQLR